MFMSNESRFYDKKIKQKESLGAKLKEILKEM